MSELERIPDETMPFFSRYLNIENLLFGNTHRVLVRLKKHMYIIYIHINIINRTIILEHYITI